MIMSQHTGLWHGTNRIVEQRILRRFCAYAQTHQSIHYSHTHSMDKGENSDQTKDLYPRWIHYINVHMGFCACAIRPNKYMCCSGITP